MLDDLAEPDDASMRIVRTFAFVDLCGFTNLTDVHGDTGAVEVLVQFRASLRRVASDRGVRIAKWLGDGAMLVGVEVRPVVEAVLDIEQALTDAGSPLPLRAGITCGPVILFEGDDHIGRTVNLAARLCDEAQPHEILAIPAVAAHVPGPVTQRQADERAVRGFGQAVPVIDPASSDHAGHAVVDPICRMQLQLHDVRATRTTREDLIVSFCSEACADAWDDLSPG